MDGAFPMGVGILADCLALYQIEQMFPFLQFLLHLRELQRSQKITFRCYQVKAESPACKGYWSLRWKRTACYFWYFNANYRQNESRR